MALAVDAGIDGECTILALKPIGTGTSVELNRVIVTGSIVFARAGQARIAFGLYCDV